MVKSSGKLFQILAFLLAATPVAAQDVGQGHAIARQWCSGCHQVELAARPPKNVAPSFLSVVQDPATTRISLAAFLSSSHQNMPDFSLTRQEIRDVSAYILSLRRAEQP